jgi:hypothetical protein
MGGEEYVEDKRSAKFSDHVEAMIALSELGLDVDTSIGPPCTVHPRKDPWPDDYPTGRNILAFGTVYIGGENGGLVTFYNETDPRLEGFRKGVIAAAAEFV